MTTSVTSSIREHLDILEYHLELFGSTGKSINEWLSPFLDIVSDDGAIPYLLDHAHQERYRASPLASSIIWLDTAGMLPKDTLAIMQQMLLYLRDYVLSYDSHNSRATNKYDEDLPGWSLGEGVSIWSTSLAIIALLDRKGYGLSLASQYKESIIWLADQQSQDGGWAYQQHRNCESNAIMTALALWALARALQAESSFGFTPNELSTLKRSIAQGFIHVKNDCVFKKKLCYWTFQKSPHCVATTWTMIALKNIIAVNGDFCEASDFFNKNVHKAIKFVLKTMPRSIAPWKSEQIVCEAGAKYNRQKNYYSYSATLLPQLFALGLSPYHPRVINQIKWLTANANNWKISEYDQQSTCSFTHAMVVATIVTWCQNVGKCNSKDILVNYPHTWFRKLIRIPLGYDYFPNSPMQLVYKKSLLIPLIIVAVFLFSRLLSPLLRHILEEVFSWLGASINDIIINVVSDYIVPAISIPVLLVINRLRR